MVNIGRESKTDVEMQIKRKCPKCVYTEATSSHATRRVSHACFTHALCVDIWCFMGKLCNPETWTSFNDDFTSMEFCVFKEMPNYKVKHQASVLIFIF